MHLATSQYYEPGFHTLKVRFIKSLSMNPATTWLLAKS